MNREWSRDKASKSISGWEVHCLSIIAFAVVHAPDSKEHFYNAVLPKLTSKDAKAVASVLMGGEAEDYDIATTAEYILGWAENPVAASRLGRARVR